MPPCIGCNWQGRPLEQWVGFLQAKLSRLRSPHRMLFYPPSKPVLSIFESLRDEVLKRPFLANPVSSNGVVDT